jgi:ribonuclease T
MTNQIIRCAEPSVECFISVDVETSGPIPGEFSLLSIGACVVHLNSDVSMTGAYDSTFYCTLSPLEGARSDPAALEVAGLSLDELTRTGKKPEEAMLGLEEWLSKVAEGMKPVFVGLNAPFDWSFINYYFHRFLGRNPFGFSAVDIKSLYMGATGSNWEGTKSSRIAATLGVSRGKMSHHALEDAQLQAKLFVAIRKLIKQERGSS